MVKRYVGYCRTAQERQHIRDRVAERRGELLDLVVERRRHDDDWPGLRKALHLAGERRAVLIIDNMAPVARDLSFLERLAEGWAEGAVEFEAIDLRAANRKSLGLMLELARRQHDSRSAAIKAGLEGARERVVKTGQRGHRRVKRLGNPRGGEAFGEEGRARGSARGVAKLKAGADEWAEKLRSRLERLLERGLSANAMARALNDAEEPTPRGGRWSAQAVIRVLERLGMRRMRGR